VQVRVRDSLLGPLFECRLWRGVHNIQLLVGLNDLRLHFDKVRPDLGLAVLLAAPKHLCCPVRGRGVAIFTLPACRTAAGPILCLFDQHELSPFVLALARPEEVAVSPLSRQQPHCLPHLAPNARKVEHHSASVLVNSLHQHERLRRIPCGMDEHPPALCSHVLNFAGMSTLITIIPANDERNAYSTVHADLHACSASRTRIHVHILCVHVQYNAHPASIQVRVDSHECRKPIPGGTMVGRDVRLVESAPSKFGGLGLMASRNFEAGDVILVETPFLSVQIFHV